MDIPKNVKKIIKEKLDLKKVSDSSLLGENLGADSLDIIEIIMAAENELDIDIGDLSVGKDTKVSELIELIEDTYRNNLTENVSYENEDEKHSIRELTIEEFNEMFEYAVKKDLEGSKPGHLER